MQFTKLYVSDLTRYHQKPVDLRVNETIIRLNLKWFPHAHITSRIMLLGRNKVGFMFQQEIM